MRPVPPLNELLHLTSFDVVCATGDTYVSIILSCCKRCFLSLGQFERELLLIDYITCAVN